MADRITTSESLGPNPHPQTGSRPASQPATAEAQGQPNPARGSRSHSADDEDKANGTPLETSAKVDGIKKQIEDIALAARDLPSSEELASFNTSMAMAAASLETLRSAEVQRAAEETEKDDK